MHRGILLSFYSSAAGFVNGKCACFLPGFLGRAQKKPRAVERLKMASACALAIFSGRIILFSRLSRSAERSKRIFTGRVVKDKRHLSWSRQKKKPAGQAGFGSVFHPSTLRGEFSTHRV